MQLAYSFLCNFMIYYKEISALIAGGLLAFAFAPMGIYPLAIFSPALLLLLWINSSAQRAFILGLISLAYVS